MNEEELSKLDKWLSDHFGQKMMAVIGAVAMVLGFGLAFLIFFYIPTLVTDLINDHIANGNLDRFRPLLLSRRPRKKPFRLQANLGIYPKLLRIF